MIHQKRDFMVFLSLFALFAALAGAGFGGQKAIIPPQQQANTPPKPKATPQLPDITVVSPHISLVSTELGKPGVEFPTDKVRFTAVIKNSGLGPCPAGASYTILLTRNGEFLTSSTATDLLSAAGSTFNYSYTDTFVHGRWYQISYKITIKPNFNEVDPNNDSAEAMVDEEILHGSGSPDFGITNLTANFVDGPAGRTYYFVVTVKNNSPIYATIGSSGYVYIDNTSTSRHIAMMNVADRKWPSPGSQVNLNLSAKASEMPTGTYTVRAKIEYPYDPNKANDVSTQTPTIKNAP